MGGGIPLPVGPRERNVLVGWLGAILVVSLAAAGSASWATLPSSGGHRVSAFVAVQPSPQTVCNLSSRDPLIFDASNPPDSLDPAVSFSTPGWGIIQQVYQTLVMYNQSSGTDFYGVLADHWNVSPDRLTYTFHLRSGIRFSSGDTLTAYGMWFSLYRALASNSSSQFLLSENFWYPGITYYSPQSNQSSTYAFVVNALNTWNFAAPTASQLAFMTASNQSFQVIDASTIALHLGAGYLGPVPYTYLLATLATPAASAVDPTVVQTNGGVGGLNPWMSAHMVGTGPYDLALFSPANGYLLRPDPSYWGTSAAVLDPGNAALQPARSSVQVDVMSNPATQVHDLESGTVAGIPSDLLTAAEVNRLKADPCVVTKAMDPVYGSTVGGWWVFMDQNTAPFNNLSVRRAVAHAIDYDRIINLAFGGYAHRWVGPVPPGYPYANPANLTPYSHDVGLAQRYMNESPWPLPAGYPTTLNYVYPNYGEWSVVATLMASDLQRIGIQVNPVGVTLDTLYSLQYPNPTTGQCMSDTSYAGGPFYIGLDFWTSDYVSPDDWTQNDAASFGAANVCMSEYANATADALVLDAAAQANPATLVQEYATLTRMMYDNVTDAWLLVPDVFQVYHPSLRGTVPNPMGSAAEFSLTVNTMYAVPPIQVVAGVTPVPVSAGDTATFSNNVTGGTPPYSIIWQMGDGTNVTSTGADFSHVYVQAGNYTASVTVRDSYGGYASSSVQVVVLAPPPSPNPPSSFPVWIVFAALAGILGVAIVVLLTVLGRKRRGRGPEMAPPPPPPPPPGP